MRNIFLYLFSHRLLAIARWDLHLLQVRFSSALNGQTGRLRRFIKTRKEPIFLNLGSGPRGVDDDHWVNVDALLDRNVHFLLDFARPPSVYGLDLRRRFLRACA